MTWEVAGRHADGYRSAMALTTAWFVGCPGTSDAVCGRVEHAEICRPF